MATIAPTDLELAEAIRAAAGLDAPGASQFESLETQRTAEGVRFRYTFDFDGFSQYDKTVGLHGQALRDAAGRWRVDEIAVDHVGVAVSFALPPARNA
jgi:hypothetical protein